MCFSDQCPIHDRSSVYISVASSPGHSSFSACNTKNMGTALGMYNEAKLLNVVCMRVHVYYL